MDRVHPGQAEPAGERPGLAAGTAPRDCVFTILTGDYEALNEQPVASRSRLPFICLTDDPGLSSASWQIRLIESRFAMDPVRSQRILKLRPEGVLGGFDRSLYIDNSVILKAPPEELFSRHLDGASLALFEHSYRDTLADEFLEVARTALDDPARIFEQLNHYVACHPEVLEQKPLWTGILLRDHRDPRLDALQSLWLDHVLRYSRRDQLSINLALSQSGLRPRLIAGDNFATALHSWPQAPGRDRWKGARSVVASQAPPSARLRGLEREHEALQRTLAAEEARHRGEESALRQGLEDRSREIAMLRQALGDRDRDVAALRGSTSWRLTGPLRALSRAARGLLRPGSPGPTALPAAAAAGPAGQFAREGFLGPVPLLTAAQCALLLRHLEGGCAAPRPDWPKTLGAADSLFGGIAARPAILALLRPVLGPDIVLWGASVVTRQPGQRHIWHVDIESATADRPSASLWIGLRNTARDSALQLVSRSHRHGKPVQQEVAERGLERGQAADETVLGWARRRDAPPPWCSPRCATAAGCCSTAGCGTRTHNRSGLARSALLLQYAAAEVAVGIPVFEHVAWPFRLTGEPAPRVLVCGRDRRGDARPVPSPCPPQAAAVATTLR
ncbi:MAG: hypothetical protein U1E53_04540 [Dongiaceae bacterium]